MTTSADRRTAVPVQDRFQAELERLEARLIALGTHETPQLEQLVRWMFAGGGKRMRPVMVYAVARLGPSDPDAVTALAAAVETLHAATLVHDDLVDNALVRRGLPALNTRWSTGATVLAGDWLFARAAQLATETGRLRVVEIFARVLGTLTDGELRQLFGRAGVPSRADYEQRIYAKTASLFEAAAEAAAVLVFGAGASEVTALKRYGYETGMAFQIVDDILDFTGDTAQLGKPVGADLQVGVVTLPALLYLERHPEAGHWLRGDGEATEDEVAALVEAVRSDQASIDGARAAARARVERALSALDALPEGPERAELAAIARYALGRNR